MIQISPVSCSALATNIYLQLPASSKKQEFTNFLLKKGSGLLCKIQFKVVNCKEKTLS